MTTLTDKVRALPEMPEDFHVSILGYDAAAYAALVRGAEFINALRARLDIACEALAQLLDDISDPTFSDPRLDYVEVQMTPGTKEECSTILAACKLKETM